MSAAVGCSGWLDGTIVERIHPEGPVLAGLAAVFPHADRALAVSFVRISPRSAMPERPIKFTKSDVEHCTTSRGSHPVPSPGSRHNQTRDQLQAVAFLCVRRKGVEPHDVWIVRQIELNHVVLVGTNGSQHDTHRRTDNPHVRGKREIAEPGGVRIELVQRDNLK